MFIKRIFGSETLLKQTRILEPLLACISNVTPGAIDQRLVESICKPSFGGRIWTIPVSIPFDAWRHEYGVDALAIARISLQCDSKEPIAFVSISSEGIELLFDNKIDLSSKSIRVVGCESLLSYYANIETPVGRVLVGLGYDVRDSMVGELEARSERFCSVFSNCSKAFLVREKRYFLPNFWSRRATAVCGIPMVEIMNPEGETLGICVKQLFSLKSSSRLACFLGYTDHSDLIGDVDIFDESAIRSTVGRFMSGEKVT